MKITALSVAALFVAPALAAKTWDVNIANGLFSPQELNIAPGDSVSWTNSDADFAIVQTATGARTCNNFAGGFNSGPKTKGQTYQRVFPTAGTINYKDGVGANCAKGAVGTINIGAAGNGTGTASGTATDPASGTATDPASGTATGTVSGTATGTVSGTVTGTATATGSRTAAPISTPTTKPNGASYLTPESSIFLGVAAFIGALVL